ncbi:hypothetical protein B0H13DRAFT_2332324 [Mycena leptocephala]|nr:hypothetical protein B0H13DRAFT_2332324 [Mycena leptocephala]
MCSPASTTWRYYRPAASRATVCAACHLSTAQCYPLPAGSAPAAPMHAAACEHIHHLTIPSRGALALSKRCPSAHPLSCPAAVYLGRLLTATLTLVGSWIPIPTMRSRSQMMALLGCVTPAAPALRTPHAAYIHNLIAALVVAARRVCRHAVCDPPETREVAVKPSGYGHIAEGSQGRHGGGNKVEEKIRVRWQDQDVMIDLGD